MEEIRNRNLGEIYTPSRLSELMISLTNEHIPNFNKTHTVWDCCWGTGNLTAGIDFNDLYASTLRQLDIRKNQGKNPGSHKFVYDFLDTDIEQLISQQAMWVQEHKLPEDLLDKLNGDNPFMFYINPPYVATGVYGTGNTDFKDGATENAIKRIMQEHSMESACDQTYAQFLYRIYLMSKAYKNKDISIAIICPPIFLSASTYKNFREKFLKSFQFMGGALFIASEFEGLSDDWGISMQIWKSGNTLDKKRFKFGLYQTNEKGQMEKFGDKIIYNIDGEVPCMDWIKGTVDNLPQRPSIITLSSGCKVSNKKPVNTVENALGYFYYRGNSVYHNEQECGLMSAPYCGGSGIPITESNFDDVIATFTARRGYSRYGKTWVNDKDEYLKPDKDSSAYKKLLMNGYIYALFNGSSNQTSLILETEEGRIDIPNNFFFLSIEEMQKMLQSAGINIVGPGKFENRTMYYKVQQALKSGLLVQKAYDIYNEWIRLWHETISLRAGFNEKEPSYQVLNWDASFYQIRQIVKDRELKEFMTVNALYRSFEDDIRYLVCEAGFLR